MKEDKVIHTLNLIGKELADILLEIKLIRIDFKKFRRDNEELK